MIETVDQLIQHLEKHRGKPLMIEDTTKNTLSHLFWVSEVDGTCRLTKSVRDYPQK